MGRYYAITLSGTSRTPSAAVGLPLSWSSLRDSGVPDPGALNIEFDFFSFEQADNQGYSTLTIWGESLATLRQAPSYGGMTMTVKAGMQQGLPLANPAQQGTILQGQVFQSFGNWAGTDMTLDFVLTALSTYTFSQPGNLTLIWDKGVSLKSALATCLGIAYPTLNTPQMLIGDDYVLSYPVCHAVNTLPQLSTFVNSITKSIKPPGVTISMNQATNTIVVSDGSIPTTKPIQIAFTDLVGQPTWIDPSTMQFTTVMRGDIQVKSIVQMPLGLLVGPGTTTLTGAAQPSQLKYQTSFQGQFVINGIRYVGNFRDPNGQSWVTVFRAAPIATTGAGPVPVIG